MSLSRNGSGVAFNIAIIIFLLYSTVCSAVIPGPEVVSSSSDTHKYRSFYLDNGLQVVLIHAPTATHAAASMNILTGASQDPTDMPGLAHFLEHMMFQGNTQFPEPDGFQKFITRNGGETNAKTLPDSTQYFLKVPQGSLPQALDRFGQMFTAPLFDPLYVERERHAVDAEYQMRRHQDSRRVMDAIGEALNPANPIARFKAGNLDTLKSAKTPLHTRLITFYKTHYSANLMRLAVSGPQSLDELQAWVSRSFSSIPNHKLNTPEVIAPLALKGQLPATLDIQTHTQTNSVLFLFPVPRSPETDRNRPVDYIFRLLLNKGPGSLQQRLEEAGLAQNVEFFPPEVQTHQMLVGIKINLSATGRTNLDQVQNTLMDYLKLIRRSGLEPWRHEAMIYHAQQIFTKAWQGDPGVIVSQVAENMGRYPLEDAMYGPFRLDKFSTGPILSVLDAMSSDNLLRVYLSNQVSTDQQSKWFSTPFHMQRIQQWPTSVPLEGLLLPQKNRFTPTDLRVLDVQTDSPELAVHQNGINIWFQADKSFGLPNAILRTELQQPKPDTDIKQHVLRLLLTGWLNKKMAPTFNESAQAGLKGAVFFSQAGLTLQVAGPRQHQFELFTKILDQLINAPVNPSDFESAANKLIKAYKNNNTAVLYKRLNQSVNLVLQKSQWLDSEKLAALQNLTSEDLNQFRHAWLSNLQVKGMITGNLEKSAPQELSQLLSARLKTDDQPYTSLLQSPRELSPHLPPLRPVSNSQDSAILLYMPVPGNNIQSTVDSQLLVKLISPDFFNSLRTQQQLGYAVSAYTKSIQEQSALLLMVQSNKYPSSILLDRTQHFVERTDQLIERLNEHEFSTLRQSIINNFQRKDESLEALADRQWTELQSGFLNFDRRQQLIATAQTRSKQDLLRTWQRLREAATLNIAFDPGQPDNIDQFIRTADTLMAPAGLKK